MSKSLYASIRCLSTLILTLFCLQAHAGSPSCIWYADAYSLYQIRTDTNLISQTVSLKDVRALAMNGKDCSVWALTGKQLYLFDDSATVVQQISIRSLKNNDRIRMVANPYDSSVWYADSKTVSHYGTNGQFIDSFTTRAPVTSMDLALNESLWIVANKHLWNYSAQGSLVATVDLSDIVTSAPKYVAIDSLNNVGWFAGEKHLTKVNLNQPNQSPVNITVSSQIAGIVVNTLNGDLWAITSTSLLNYDRHGQLKMSVNPSTNNLSGIGTVAFDAQTQSLWTGANKGIGRYSAQGQYVATVTASFGETALAAPVLMVSPTLSIVRPSQGTYTNNARQPITYEFDALCNNQSCGFTPHYISGYALTANLNRRPIGPFTFDNTAGQRTYTPAQQLQEGLNNLTASAIDNYGHSTGIVNISFTVDTIPPKFLSITPLSGSVVTTPAITLQGVVDDPTALVVLNGVGQAAARVNGNNNLAFGIPLTLTLGLNNFVLTTMDKASNQTVKNMEITYQPSVASFKITSPVNGAIINGKKALVSGTFVAGEQVGINVNGVVATLIGNNFYANVPLKFGTNKLTTTIVTLSGFKISQDISVKQVSSSPFNAIPSSAQGLAPLSVNFGFGGQATTKVQSVRADFNGAGQFTAIFNLRNGEVPATVYTQPGVYQALFEITDTTGEVSTVTTTILVRSAAELDVTLRASYSDMMQKLVANDTRGALAYVHGNAVEKYTRVFKALGSALPLIVPQLGTLGVGRFSDNIAEYIVTRNSSSGPTSFLIYFVRSGDGIWRIEAM